MLVEKVLICLFLFLILILTNFHLKPSANATLKGISTKRNAKSCNNELLRKRTQSVLLEHKQHGPFIFLRRPHAYKNRFGRLKESSCKHTLSNKCYKTDVSSCNIISLPLCDWGFNQLENCIITHIYLYPLLGGEFEMSSKVFFKYKIIHK